MKSKSTFCCNQVTILLVYCIFSFTLYIIPHVISIESRSFGLHEQSNDKGSIFSARSLLSDQLKEWIGSKIVKGSIDSQIKDFDLDQHSKHAGKNSISLKHSKARPELYYLELLKYDNSEKQYYCLGYNTHFLEQFDSKRL